MLGRDRISICVSMEAFAPDGVKAIRVQTGDEFGPRRSCYTMPRIQIVPLSEKVAMIRRMPILSGVDSTPGQFQQPIDVGHDLQTARHRQIFGAERSNTRRGVDDEA